MKECIHCDTENEDAARACVSCGRAMGSPHGDRLGDRYVLFRGAVPPPVCIKCGAAVTTQPAVKPFYWHPPAWYLLILVNLLVYVVVAMIVRKRFDVAVPLCDAHLARRRTLRWTAGGLLAASAALFAVTFVLGKDGPEPFTCVGSVLSFFASFIVFAVGERTLLPKRIDEESAEFGGVCNAFLAKL